MLIERGHAGVWDYGWSLYLTLLELVAERSKDHAR